MKDIKLLFSRNRKQDRSRRIKVGSGYYLYSIENCYLNVELVHEIILFLNSVVDNTHYNLPVRLEFRRVKGDVKLPIILLECIAYYVLTMLGKSILFLFNVETNIYTNYLRMSPLGILNCPVKNRYKVFAKKFLLNISMRHYRRVLESNALETDVLSKSYDDIYHFIINNGISDCVAENIAEVVIELMGNASEHGNSDCLLDIDIDDTIYNRKNHREFYGINVCILNFSEKLFYDDIKYKMEKMEPKAVIHTRYSALYNAYKFHEKHVNSKYTIDDFFTIAAYQHRISGRKDETIASGGTGLTKLIKNLQVQSEVYHCFMISGNRCLYFDKKYLDYDKDEWLGFNLSKNFLSDIPATSQFVQHEFFMPGTAYNLNFIIEKGH